MDVAHKVRRIFAAVLSKVICAMMPIAATTLIFAASPGIAQRGAMMGGDGQQGATCLDP